MTSQKFKQELKQEAQKWRSEGLISQDIWQNLDQRYQLSNLTKDSSDRFTAIIITLGCILVGLAVITFVAANWQEWSKPIKVVILITTFLATNLAGFFTWQRGHVNWRSRLGQGLLIVGALVLGANIGLMSQLFHHTGGVYQLFLIWGAAVLLMAYGLNLASLGIIAIILISIGYFNGLGSSLFRETNIVMNFFPLLIGTLFIPLAYRCRSQWLFFLSSCLLVTAFTVECIQRAEQVPVYLQGLLLAIAVTLPIAFFWSYQDKSKILTFPTKISFSNLGQNLAIFCLSIALYASSFNWWSNAHRGNQKLVTDWLYPNYPLVFTIIAFTLITIYFWWQLGKSEFNQATWRLDKHNTYMAIALGVLGSLYIINFSFSQMEAIATLIVNILLFAMAIILIRYALKTGQRSGYWAGILLLALQVISRMLEFNTDLLFKALVLFVCGVAIIVAGIWFEKNKTKSPSSIESA